ncbi:MAG: gamma-glutamyltransferase [Betaproteobacteria bacterium]
MKILLPFLIAAFALVTAMAQAPGDRPASHPRGTRSVVMARHGMVASSQPLASAAGLRVLEEGGNAIDAAVTAAAVLAVVEPNMNGIGGDLFAIVHDGRTNTLHGLNSSGRSGYAATPAAFAARGLTKVPGAGVLSVTVPGVVEGWSQLLQKYGTISLARALAPAIQYAREGYPVSEIIATDWAVAARKLARDPAAAATFLPNGRAPKPGEIFSNPHLADSLEEIAKEGRDAFYTGALAGRIVADIRKRDGLLAARDFADYHADWVDPITTSYRGYDVYELPPNTQGITALEMLNILEGYDMKALGHNTAESLHLLVEAKRIAFADRNAYVADPESVPPSVLKTLLSKEYAAARRKEIDPLHAAAKYLPAAIDGRTPSAGPDPVEGRDLGDTVYLTAADGHGNMVSLIQSLFDSFGSGIVAGDTGITLQNRGSLFTLEPGHPDRIAPHKRPLHTLVPAMVMHGGKPWLTFGVMGGDMQPQGHVQVLMNLIDYGMDIQSAGEAARVRDLAAGVALETGIPAETVFGLNRRGHRLVYGVGLWGGFQGIMIDPATGVLMGGSDPRKDGLAIGF